MIFMNFKTPISEAWAGMGNIWLEIEHIESVRACPEQADRSCIVMSSGHIYEVEGYVEDILKEIINEYGERWD